jgi:hypothetical protein
VDLTDDTSQASRTNLNKERGNKTQTDTHPGTQKTNPPTVQATQATGTPANVAPAPSPSPAPLGIDEEEKEEEEDEVNVSNIAAHLARTSAAAHYDSSDHASDTARSLAALAKIYVPTPSKDNDDFSGTIQGSEFTQDLMYIAATQDFSLSQGPITQASDYQDDLLFLAASQSLVDSRAVNTDTHSHSGSKRTNQDDEATKEKDTRSSRRKQKKNKTGTILSLSHTDHSPRTLSLPFSLPLHLPFPSAVFVRLLLLCPSIRRLLYRRPRIRWA